MIDSWNVYLSPSSSTISSSARSSHLSLLSSSSISSAPSDPSPLPSPSFGGGSKTAAFFGSPFGGDHSSSPSPPPNPVHSRPASIRSVASSVATSDEGHEETPKVEHLIPKRSLNADFFGQSLLPTPPSSISSRPGSAAVSRETSPAPAKSTLPPLSRFFPSRRRYNASDDSETSESPQRGVLQLDVHPPQAHKRDPWLGEAYTASPVEDTRGLHAPPHSHLHPSPLSHVVPLPPSPPMLPKITGTSAPGIAESSALTTPVPQPERTAYVAQPAAETPAPASTPEVGKVIGGPELELELVRGLGQGAFSSVWLARDVGGKLGAFELRRMTSLLRSRSQKRGRGTTARVDGLRPAMSRVQGDGAVSLRKVRKEVDRESAPGRLVALKMTEKAMCEKNSRTRVSFVREVEVLRHISHPSIVSFLHSFSTSSHHCLVLEYVGGGELFDLIDNVETHSRMDEPLLRRMFGELCRAVAWMHGVGLVHRDIKLENILLTTSPFASPLPSTPLIKLSDFGLSRFIDPASPQLTTLCGSESYAAPELVMGRPYDGRETDAWACGVVLYALAARMLPFDRPPADPSLAPREAPVPERVARRALLMRIAKCEYAWPEPESAPAPDADVEATPRPDGERPRARLSGASLALSEGVRKVAGRLLVRDSRKRARVVDLWEDEWMHGEGAVPVPTPVSPPTMSAPMPAEASALAQEDAADVVSVEGEPSAENDADPAEADVEDEDGVLVDSQDIVPGSVAHQEH